MLLKTVPQRIKAVTFNYKASHTLHILFKSKKQNQNEPKKNAMTEVWDENEMVLNSLIHFNTYNKNLLLQLENNFSHLMQVIL